MSSIFYRLFHCKTPNHQINNRGDNPYERRDFVDSLSFANMGNGFWEEDWKILEIFKEGNILVQKNGLNLCIYNVNLIKGSELKLNNKVEVFMPKEYCSLMPGFYLVNGNMSLKHNSTILRIYWNVKSEGAVFLVNQITIKLNKQNIPFQFKIINNKYNFNRSDSAVLYINKDKLPDTLKEVIDIYKGIRFYIKDDTSMFTKQLFPGLSLAEDPNNNESFGQHRCRLLAEAFYYIYKNNIVSTDNKINSIIKYFNSHNIDVNHPYAYLDTINYYDSILQSIIK
jgi:hypothetical protein